MTPFRLSVSRAYPDDGVQTRPRPRASGGVKAMYS